MRSTTSFSVLATCCALFIGNDANSQTKTSSSDAVAWSDQRYPDIDYTTNYASYLNEAGADFIGWWGLFNDSEDEEPFSLLAINFSAVEDVDDPNSAMLLAQCANSTNYLAFFPRELDQGGTGDVVADVADWVSNAAREARVTSQLDANESSSVLWRKVGTGTGVFLSGPEATQMLKNITESSELKLTLGAQIDPVSHSFKLAGSDIALGPFFDECSG